MKTFRLLALLPLISAQTLLGQTNSPVSPDSTSGSTSVNFTGVSANKGAGGIAGRIPVASPASAGAVTNTAGIVTSGVTTAPAATTNTTTISGTSTGTHAAAGAER